ncbi:isopentenyl-diphosphate Delta-isomerase [Salipiger sp.]|uniref:isopentenyl-diphosphate Delta-isomerase n=1 Tax=Salipiger sp. TaxID=2078585 RepID=UPI003A974F75
MTDQIPAWVDGTLRPVDKLEAHLRGLRHKAISVFVLRGDAVLIQRRALGKYHTPGLWANTCCTHPHWEESPLHCASRRLHEELGIDGIPLTPRGQVEYRADVGGGMIEHELVDIFVGHAPETLVITPNPDEVMDTAWVPLDELHRQTREESERFTPWLRIYLDQHSEQILPDL